MGCEASGAVSLNNVPYRFVKLGYGNDSASIDTKKQIVTWEGSVIHVTAIY